MDQPIALTFHSALFHLNKKSIIASSFLSHLKQSLELRIWDFAGWKQVFNGALLFIFLHQAHGVNPSINSTQLCLLRQGQTKQQKETVSSSIRLPDKRRPFTDVHSNAGRADRAGPAKSTLQLPKSFKLSLGFPIGTQSYLEQLVS